MRLPLILFVPASFLWTSLSAAPAAKGLTVFSNGASALCLDVSDELARSVNLYRPLNDLQVYFQEMTGAPLPRTRSPLLFNPAIPETLRCECLVPRMIDESPNSLENGTVSLALSPTQFFEKDVLAGPGEKVAWQCTWHKAARQLEVRLLVANKPYYGPGYGPFTFAQLKADAPDLKEGAGFRLALEMRHENGRDIRGGYSLEGAPWVYTDWFDPTQAGVDTRVPGQSDKNGAQGWTRDWPATWSEAAAFYVTAYGAKDRMARVWIGQLEVTQGGRNLFAADFRSRSGSLVDRVAPWTRSPLQGKVAVDTKGAILEPDRGAWSTVGLRADRLIDAGNLIPLRLKLLPSTATQGVPEAATVQGYEIHVSPQEIVLQAHTPLGLQNALYSLLDRWGCRWVMPGKIGEVIPKRDRLTLPVGVLESVPNCDTSVEAAGGREEQMEDWYNRNQTGWEKWLTGQHYWFYALPPEKYFKDHPEWYALIGGQRVATQLCTSNPEVIAKTIEVSRDFLRARPIAISFPMDPMDNIDFCQCDRCRAQDPPGRGESGTPMMTDRVVRFANAVADGLRQEFPNKLVAFCAYWTHEEPPVNVKPAKNVAVLVTRSNHCLLHLTPNPRCASSVDFYRLVKQWSELTRYVYMYEYDPISWTGFLPCPIYLDRAASIKLLSQKYRVRGGVTDRAPRQERAASTFINNYFERRMKADPNRDPDTVLVDLCQGFFGPASGPMQRYYRELARVTQYLHPGRDRVGVGTYKFHELFNKPMLTSARRSMDEALAVSANQTPYAERVRMVDGSLRYLEAYLEGVWSAQAKDYSRSVTAFDRMDSVIEELAKSGLLDAEDARFRATSMRLKTLAEHFPDRLGLVRKWKLLGPFNNDSRDADFRTGAFEPIRSIDKSITLADGKVADWWPYDSSEGLVNLEKAFKGKTAGWKLSYAYAGIRLTVPHNMQVQFRMDSFFPFHVYVNGQEVYHRPGLDADCPDKRIFPVTLPAGESTVVIKLSQSLIATDSFPWGLYFRITDDAGKAIEEVGKAIE